MLIFLLLFSFAGCGDDVRNDTKLDLEESTREKVGSKQIVEDLSKNEVLKNCFPSDFVKNSKLNYVSHKVIKRQTNSEEKTDLIFCSIKSKNKYFTADLETKLVYNYYDEGGWILDETIISEKKVVPISAPDKTLVIEGMIDCLNGKNNDEDWDIPYIEEELLANEEFDDVVKSMISPYKSDLKITKSELKKEIGEARYYVNMDVCVSKIKGYISLSFDENNGWKWTLEKKNITRKQRYYPAVIITEMEFGDFSGAIGAYVTPTLHKSDGRSYSLSFNIKKTDVTNEIYGTITLNGNRSGSINITDSRKYSGEREFNILNGVFWLDNDHFYYNPSERIWMVSNNGEFYKCEKYTDE